MVKRGCEQHAWDGCIGRATYSRSGGCPGWPRRCRGAAGSYIAHTGTYIGRPCALQGPGYRGVWVESGALRGRDSRGPQEDTKRERETCDGGVRRHEVRGLERARKTAGRKKERVGCSGTRERRGVLPHTSGSSLLCSPGRGHGPVWWGLHVHVLCTGLPEGRAGCARRTDARRASRFATRRARCARTSNASWRRMGVTPACCRGARWGRVKWLSVTCATRGNVREVSDHPAKSS